MLQLPGGSTACHGVVAGRGCGVGPNAEQHLLIAYLGADVRSLARPQNQMRRLRRRTPAAHTDEHEPTLSQFVMPGARPGATAVHR